MKKQMKVGNNAALKQHPILFIQQQPQHCIHHVFPPEWEDFGRSKCLPQLLLLPEINLRDLATMWIKPSSQMRLFIIVMHLQPCASMQFMQMPWHCCKRQKSFTSSLRGCWWMDLRHRHETANTYCNFMLQLQINSASALWKSLMHCKEREHEVWQAGWA